MWSSIGHAQIVALDIWLCSQQAMIRAGVQAQGQGDSRVQFALNPAQACINQAVEGIYPACPHKIISTGGFTGLHAPESRLWDVSHSPVGWMRYKLK